MIDDQFSYADAARVASVMDLPDDALRCLCDGHHWNDPLPRPAPGWGNVSAEEYRFQCEVDGRQKREVIDADTGEILTRNYGAGTLLASGARVTRAEARHVRGIRRRMVAARLAAEGKETATAATRRRRGKPA